MRSPVWFSVLTVLSVVPAVHPAIALDEQEHWQQTIERAYEQSVQDAAQTEAHEIAPLTPLVQGNNQSIWREINGEPHVLLVTWTNWDGYDALQGQTTTLGRETWTTPVPTVQDKIKTIQPSADILTLRLEQLLGLPPNNGKTKWVELWVKPADIFRPCPDVEITDDRCGLYFPSDASPEHKAWFVNLSLSSYGDRGYPWTRLGYTYDWGALGTEVGANELVIKAGAEVVVNQVQPNAAYFELPNP
jgi:hypothetical protein